MLNYRAIASGAAVMLLLAVATMVLLWTLNDGVISSPQLLTTTSLWAVAGIVAGRKSAEAGLLHGMLAGLLGGTAILLLQLLPLQVPELSLLTSTSARGYMALLVLSGLWGGVGGLFADIARVGRARRAQRKAARMEVESSDQG